MPIRFRCSCGKQLQAREEFAGRQMKCPDCGQILTIPATSTVEESEAAPPAEQIPSVEAVSTGVTESESGPPVLQPAPQEGEQELAKVIPVVPVIPLAPVGKPKAVHRNEWAAESLDQQITPWAKNDQQRVGEISDRERIGGRLVSAVVIVLLLVGLLGAAWYFQPQIAEHFQAQKEYHTPFPEKWIGVSDLNMIPDRGALLVSVRVADIWKHPARKTIVKALLPESKLNDPTMKWDWGLTADEIERLTIFALPGEVVDVTHPTGLYALIKSKEPYDRDFMQWKLTEKPFPERINGIETLRLLRYPYITVAFINDRTLLFAETSRIKKFLEHDFKKRRGPLSPSLLLASEPYPLVIGAAAPKRWREALPGPLAQWSRPLEKLLNAQGMALTVTLNKEAMLDLHLVYGDDKKAKQVAAAAGKLKMLAQTGLGQKRKGIEEKLKAGQFAQVLPILQESARLVLAQSSLAAMPPVSPVQIVMPVPALARELGKLPTLKKEEAQIKKQLARLDEAEAVVNAIKIQSAEDKVLVTVTLEKKKTGPVENVLNAAAAFQTMARLQNQNKLKQLALAMHNYHAAKGHLPAASIGKGLSWRVALLPYLGYKELYEQFTLDEPWDSAKNKKLLAKMPDVFAPSIYLGNLQGKTFFQVFVGPKTAFEAGKKIKLADFNDGTSNTLLIAETSRAVPWTAPQDLPFKKKDDFAGLHSVFMNDFQAAFADGSVRSLSLQAPADELRARVTRNGGEVLKKKKKKMQ